MRTNKFFKTGLLLFVASLGLISCGDDDKEPEIVIDPVSENVEVSIRPRACFFPLFSFLPLWLHYNLNPLCVQY